MQTAITTADTKGDALRSVRLTERSRQALAIEDIVRRYAPENEHRNLTGARFNTTTSGRMPSGLK